MGARLWAHCLLLLPSSGIITSLSSQFDCSVCQLSGTAACLQLCCPGTHLMPAACIGARRGWLISNTDSIRYLE